MHASRPLRWSTWACTIGTSEPGRGLPGSLHRTALLFHLCGLSCRYEGERGQVKGQRTVTLSVRTEDWQLARRTVEMANRIGWDRTEQLARAHRRARKAR